MSELKPKLDMAEAIRRRWGGSIEGWNPSLKFAHNDILDLLDVIDALKAALDARPWPQGDEAAQQLAEAIQHVRYAGASPLDSKPAWMRELNIDTAAAVLARLNADTTTKESEQ